MRQVTTKTLANWPTHISSCKIICSMVPVPYASASITDNRFSIRYAEPSFEELFGYDTLDIPLESLFGVATSKRMKSNILKGFVKEEPMEEFGIFTRNDARFLKAHVRLQPITSRFYSVEGGTATSIERWGILTFRCGDLVEQISSENRTVRNADSKEG